MKSKADSGNAGDIIPLVDMSDEEIKIGKEKVFLLASKLLSDEGYVLDSTLTARAKDSDSPQFKERYARNGFEYRSITNIEGWLVQFKYQRYRTRQQNKIKGAEREVKFVDLNPRSIKFNDGTIGVVQTLYEKRYTVPEIIKMFREQKGVELKASTIRYWIKNIERGKDTAEINITDMESEIREKKVKTATEKTKQPTKKSKTKKR